MIETAFVKIDRFHEVWLTIFHSEGKSSLNLTVLAGTDQDLKDSVELWAREELRQPKDDDHRRDTSLNTERPE
jgi:hypothetical protein